MVRDGGSLDWRCVRGSEINGSGFESGISRTGKTLKTKRANLWGLLFSFKPSISSSCAVNGLNYNLCNFNRIQNEHTISYLGTFSS